MRDEAPTGALVSSCTITYRFFFIVYNALETCWNRRILIEALMRFYGHAPCRLQKILNVQSHRLISWLFVEGSSLLSCISWARASKILRELTNLYLLRQEVMTPVSKKARGYTIYKSYFILSSYICGISFNCMIPFRQWKRPFFFRGIMDSTTTKISSLIPSLTEKIM